MRVMKLGNRPDTFFSSGPVRSVSTDLATDMQILVDGCLFRLHKFPLLSKCMWLQALCVESGDGGAVELPAFPGGAEAFEACAKFCYGVAVTIGPHNVVAVRCAAARLGMSEAADRGNLAVKLDAFLSSCLLRRWKDALAVLRSTRSYVALCEELGVTARCVDAVAALVVPDPNGDAFGAAPANSSSPPWWARDISELGVDLYWRVMVAVKATGTVHGKAIGDALKAYARRWLPVATKNHHAVERTGGGTANAERATKNHRLLVEKIVSLLPAERNAVSCGFFLKLLKAANILGASPASKAELTRRAASQLEDANVSDLLIPAATSCAGGTLYDVDAVVTILEEFALRQAAASGSPEGSPARAGRHRRSRSAESGELEGARRSTSMAAVSHGAMVRVGRLVDGFLAVVAKDARTPLDKMIAVAEAVPDFARPEHDDLYRAIDTYLMAHPEMDKSSRKKLCRVLNCRKLSEKASMHAAQNELLPLRVVVQVLFFENARAAGHGNRVSAGFPGDGGDVSALVGRPRTTEEDSKDEQSPAAAGSVAADGDWSVEGLRRAASRVATLKMRLEEEDDEAFVHRTRAALARSASSRVAAAAGRSKRMLSRLWPTSRTFT
uniref:NPH3 domain-containing protein n=1 Tax=Oryza punctata TaxID=4537 RepID=A0A0E0KRW4_ORYPU